ncbi:hypothetical protein A6V39_01340 [Candidatus Mycoplasma haematobovis]|uniref:Uncharacterized protein n=1 Tax=Candidatus Mycoplasma haematobovis TaxID=432608 RepID=A0A1A9QEM3_9MOLU|nr:hypothetical protein [Candidatus Mycoplasma haematobovis]OAL10698.1 hypothetical protein A6V39_01340 [Candidatus Mycoplasma haematobovis]
MTLPVKIGVGALTVGTISGVSYAGSAYLMNSKEKASDIKQQLTTIDELIKDKFEYVLLSTSQDTGNTDNNFWKTNWEKYNSENSASETGKDPLQLAGWTKNNKTDLTSELKKKCSTLSTLNVPKEGNATYLNVIKYCSRGVTLAEQAKKDGLTVLDTSSTNKDSAIWTKKHSEKQTLQDSLNKLEITNSDTGDKIKEGCATAQSKNKQVTNYPAIYEAYKLVCTKQTSE